MRLADAVVITPEASRYHRWYDESVNPVPDHCCSVRTLSQNGMFDTVRYLFVHGYLHYRDVIIGLFFQEPLKHYGSTMNDMPIWTDCTAGACGMRVAAIWIMDIGTILIGATPTGNSM